MRALVFSLLLLFASLFIISCSSTSGGVDAAAGDAATDAAPDAARVAPRVLVVPFENRAASRSQGVITFGLSATLAERLEGEPSLAVINGPLVLTREQCMLVARDGTGLDLAVANVLAAERGATHFVTGRMSGQVWTWTFEAEIYETRPEGPRLVGRGTSFGDLTAPVTTRSGRTVRTLNARNIHTLFTQAVAEAFRAAGFPLGAGTLASLEAPSTQDAYAFLLLSRAYARYFGTPPAATPRGEDDPEDPALTVAGHAVNVDPSFPEAQRFYAGLLVEAGRMRSARIHYEVAVRTRPSDVRSLIELARLEIEARNPDIARGYLLRAVDARPADAVARFWLARAFLALDDMPHAIEQFERTRTLDPGHLDARRELVRLYADARRYADAAGELREVVYRAPEDLDAVFMLAACLRAAGLREDAIAAYESAYARFPNEARLRKFRGDLYRETGRPAEARLEYEAARRLAHRDARLAALIDHPDAPLPADLLGGSALVTTVTEGLRRAGAMETHRAAFQLAITDAVLDLTINGAEACRDGRGASSALFARDQGRLFHELGRTMAASAAALRRALRDGEGASLTPDERRNADSVLSSADAAERDIREMRSMFDATFVPLYRRHACETFDGPIRPATIGEVRARDADRRVTLPEVRPPAYSLPISPHVAPERSLSIRFRVVNGDDSTAYVLYVDGTELGAVAPGREGTFTARLGPHRLCLVPRGAVCGPSGTVRNVYLHERWTIRVRPGA